MQAWPGSHKWRSHKLTAWIKQRMRMLFEELGDVTQIVWLYSIIPWCLPDDIHCPSESPWNNVFAADLFLFHFKWALNYDWPCLAPRCRTVFPLSFNWGAERLFCISLTNCPCSSLVSLARALLTRTAYRHIYVYTRFCSVVEVK